MWFVVTVRKHIVPQEALAGAGVAVGVDKPSQNRVVISALQVVEVRLFGRAVAIEAKKRSICLLNMRVQVHKKVKIVRGFPGRAGALPDAREKVV